MNTYVADVTEAVGVAVDQELNELTNLAPMDRATMADVKKKVVKAAEKAAAGVPIPSTRTADLLWKILVWTLSAVVLLAVVGVGWTVLDGSADTVPDVLVTIFTAALTGLIGLFVKPQS